MLLLNLMFGFSSLSIRNFLKKYSSLELNTNKKRNRLDIDKDLLYYTKWQQNKDITSS